MEILDHEEKTPNPTESTIGNIGGIAYLIGGIACLIGLYGSWLCSSSLMSAGAPDAMQLSKGIRIALYAQFTSIIMLIIGLVFQSIAFSKYAFSPLWLWRVMLFCGISAICASIVPLNPFSLILGVVILVHVFTKKRFYQNEESDMDNT